MGESENTHAHWSKTQLCPAGIFPLLVKTQETYYLKRNITVRENKSPEFPARYRYQNGRISVAFTECSWPKSLAWHSFFHNLAQTCLCGVSVPASVQLGGTNSALHGGCLLLRRANFAHSGWPYRDSPAQSLCVPMLPVFQGIA